MSFQRIGGLTVIARYGPEFISARARAGLRESLNARLLAEIDEHSPGLSEAERQKRLVYARKAHYARLALKSAQIRRAKAVGHV
jgi:hypothetical protein